MVQRFDFGTQQPDRSRYGGFVRYEDYKALADLLARIVVDASPCTSACSRLVDEKLIEESEELLGKAVPS